MNMKYSFWKRERGGQSEAREEQEVWQLLMLMIIITKVSDVTTHGQSKSGSLKFSLFAYVRLRNGTCSSRAAIAWRWFWFWWSHVCVCVCGGDSKWRNKKLCCWHILCQCWAFSLGWLWGVIKAIHFGVCSLHIGWVAAASLLMGRMGFNCVYLLFLFADFRYVCCTIQGFKTWN